MKKTAITALLLLAVGALTPGCNTSETADSTVGNLIPMPRSITITGSRLVSPSQTVIDTDVPDSWDDEQYSLTVTPQCIRIASRTQRGAVWAARTLRQLCDPQGRYPQVKIEDRPEFPIRGFMWDDGRNFVGTEILRHYLEMMSDYKLNLFQWHLTDHPAWRIECRCHPELNDPRYQRAGRDTGCFYTYDQIREIISYAGELGITVVPEIDMPGHSNCFRTAFGCTMDSEKGRRILEECIAEFCEQIPAEMCPVIHIGSDEVHIDDPEGFMEWSQQLLRSYGRRTMVWDPGLPADTMSIRQVWRDGSPDDSEIRTDTPFVDSSMGYLNYYDPLLFPAKMFFHTPCYTGRSSRTALGGILCMWNDVRAADKSAVEHHNGMAAGLMVFAERFWNGGRTAEEYTGTLLPDGRSDEMQRFARFQQRMMNHKHRFLADELAHWTPLGAPEWQIELSSGPQRFTSTVFGDILDLDAICRMHGIDPREQVDCRIRRTIESRCDTVVRFLVGFDSPTRSNRISGGIPQQGYWPNGGCVTVNGKPLAPPHWNEPESYAFHFNTWARPEEEFPYTDEQLYWMQQPQPVALRKGRNEVELTISRHFKGQRFHAAFIEFKK